MNTLQTILKENNLRLLETLEEGGRAGLYKVEGSKNIQPLFLKIGIAKNSIFLKNYYFWTKQLAEKTPPKAKFYIPKPINSGTTNNNHWILTEFIGGTPFAKLTNYLAKFTVQNPQKYFTAIADLIFFLENSSALGLRGIDFRIGKETDTSKNTILHEAIKLTRNNTPHLAELLQIIDTNYKNLGKSVNHCDVTPLNLMIDKKDRIVLIDADLADILTFKYYDFAEFFNRLYTLAGAPELAKKFLAVALGKIKKEETKNFLNNFLCLSALRAIANFTEIENVPQENQKTRLKYATNFVDDIINYKII